MVIFNPTSEAISKRLAVPLYYTGLTKTALISEEAVRTVENPAVIIADQRGAGLGLGQPEDQRIVGMNNMGNISSVSPLEQRLIGAINVLPKL